MSAAEARPEDERVLLLAPTPKDAAMTRHVLAGVGVACTPCATVEALCAEVAGGAGAVVLTEHALALREIGAFADLLRRQPPWSDLPVVVLAGGGANTEVGRRVMELFGNVTVLERPVQMASLASVIRTLIRSRHRQYQIREHLRERERAQDEAERSLAQWQAVVGSMTEGLVLADAEGNLLMMNPAALAIHEFASVGDMLRKLDDYPNLFELRDADGQFLPLRDWPISRALRGERFSGYEVQVHRRDTGRTWVGSYGGTAVREAGGGVRLAVLTLRDITDRRKAEAALRESEARYRSLFESIDEGFCVVEVLFEADGRAADYRFLEVNPAFEKQTGIADAVGRRIKEIAPLHEDHWFETYGGVARTGEAVRFENDAKSLGRAFDVYAFRVGRPEQARVAILFRDVTERRRIDEELRRHAAAREELLTSERAARAEAERTSLMKDEFLATLSHELRTPLNAILGWSQILSRPHGAADAEDLAEGLRTIERNARAQTRIIEDLLDMSRIINGKVRLDVQRIELAAVIEAALETVGPAAEAKDIRVQKVLDPLSGPVTGDPNRLQQVFWNLLSNAIKFTPKGGRVQVLLERVNSHLEVSVIDTGEGIRPEFLPHVFDRFRQADPSTTRRHGGLGLGLAIVKQLVELHGGTIRAKSPGPGQGSTFVVTLPLTVIHPEQAPERVRRHPRASPTDPPTNGDCVTLDGVKVLVVDDEPDARALVKRLLEDCRATVMTAASAAEALQLVRKEPPAVIVSDIGMPGEDGYALIRSVRALGRDRGGDTPAVALTAYARSEDRVRAVQNGFQLHVAKPVEPAELVMMVAALAGRAVPRHPN